MKSVQKTPRGRIRERIEKLIENTPIEYLLPVAPASEYVTFAPVMEHVKPAPPIENIVASTRSAQLIPQSETWSAIQSMEDRAISKQQLSATTT